ncbi:MAG: DUF4149 domain-containing protein, partial [Deltaproteobacteria bacterium]|nr:DUF4149 domain-containing protein [Deltaproteobacteria bacterium]
TAIIAPVVFKLLPIADAGKLVAGLFPRYYILGYIAGTIALALAIYFTVERQPKLWWGLSAFVLAVALGLTIYAGAIVRPQVDAIRTVVQDQNPDPARKAEFDRLHRLSVMLNGGVMLLNLAALMTTATALTRNG